MQFFSGTRPGFAAETRSHNGELANHPEESAGPGLGRLLVVLATPHLCLHRILPIGDIFLVIRQLGFEFLDSAYCRFDNERI